MRLVTSWRSCSAIAKGSCAATRAAELRVSGVFQRDTDRILELLTQALPIRSKSAPLLGDGHILLRRILLHRPVSKFRQERDDFVKSLSCFSISPVKCIKTRLLTAKRIEQMPEKYVRKPNRNANAMRCTRSQRQSEEFLLPSSARAIGLHACGLRCRSGYQSAQKSYQVSAGPLGPALMDFAAQAGINLSMDLSSSRTSVPPACLVSTPSIAVLHICWKARD
jgi:hypothetical protein